MPSSPTSDSVFTPPSCIEEGGDRDKVVQRGGFRRKMVVDGSPDFTMEEVDKTDRARTDNILYIDDETKNSWKRRRSTRCLKKYCRSYPSRLSLQKTGVEGWQLCHTDEDNVINDTAPPETETSRLKEKDYLNSTGSSIPYQ